MKVTHEGVQFIEGASGRAMMLLTSGPFAGWLAARDAEGLWVAERLATEGDRLRIRDARGDTVELSGS